jgi:hypothetical protein
MKKAFAVFLVDPAFLKTSFDLWARSSKRLLACALLTIKTNLITVALSIVLAAILASLWG